MHRMADAVRISNNCNVLTNKNSINAHKISKPQWIKHNMYWDGIHWRKSIRNIFNAICTFAYTLCWAIESIIVLFTELKRSISAKIDYLQKPYKGWIHSESVQDEHLPLITQMSATVFSVNNLLFRFFWLIAFDPFCCFS